MAHSPKDDHVHARRPTQFESSGTTVIGKRANGSSAETSDDRMREGKRRKQDEETRKMKKEILQVSKRLFCLVGRECMENRQPCVTASESGGVIKLEKTSLREIRERVEEMQVEIVKNEEKRRNKYWVFRNWNKQIEVTKVKALSSETPTNIIFREAFFLLEEMIGEGSLSHQMIRCYSHFVNLMRNQTVVGGVCGVASMVTLTKETEWFLVLATLIQEANVMAREAQRSECEWALSTQGKIDEMARRLAENGSPPNSFLIISRFPRVESP